MNAKKSAYGIFLIPFISIVYILSLTGCPPRERPQPTEERESVRIGAVLPLTGDIASYGKNAQKGMDLALEEIRGSEDYPVVIEVEYQDGMGDAQESVTIMNKFCTIDHYPVAVGAAASSVSMALAPIANRHEVVQISPISSSPELTLGGGDFFFRVCPSDAFQASILAEWIWGQGTQSVGILYVNNSWGISLKDRFTEEYTAMGGQVTTVESSNEGDRDFRTQLSKIIATAPEAFYSPTYGAEGGLILRQINELGFDKPVFGSDVWSSPELVTTAGGAAEGVSLVKPSQYAGARYEEFRARYVEEYGEEPDVYAAYSYDIIMILEQAFAADHRTGPAIRDYLYGMPPYEGVTGTTQFDENGDCNTKPFIRQRIEGGEYVDIEPGE